LHGATVGVDAGRGTFTLAHILRMGMATTDDDLPDGCGCVEMWEYMCARRNDDADTD